MPDLIKTSVRDELDRLKTDYQKQSDAGLVSKESQLLTQGLFTLLELIVAIFLEKKTTKTSKNSSKPSSQTDKDETTPSKAVNPKAKKRKRKLPTIPAQRKPFPCRLFLFVKPVVKIYLNNLACGMNVVLV